jgi:hypothetical protein
MIRLPAQLMPSELLCCEDLSPFIRRLLEGACKLASESKWDEAERCLLHAVEATQEMGAPLNRGVALVHMGDIHRAMGKPGPALIDYRRAQRIFKCQAPCRQRHNEAVASYALGLVHHLLGSEMDALKWYDKSTELLRIARAHWAGVNALARVDACSRLERWMAVLSDDMTGSLTHSEASPSFEVWVPVVLAEKGGSCVEQVEVRKRDSELEGQVNRFRVHPLEEHWSPTLAPDSQYGALEMPAEIRRTLHAGEGDHALIQWEGSSDAGTREPMGELSLPDLGGFSRDIQGRIYFTRPVTRIIGGGRENDYVRIGRIAARLEPTDPA